MKPPNKIVFLVFLGVFFVFIDVFIKNYITSIYKLAQTEYITSFLNITNLHNRGAAFSLLSSYSGWQNYALIIFAIIIVIAIVTYIKHTDENYVVSIFLICILSGSIGNMWDRIYYKYVVDYIHFHFYGYSFPVFNFADMLITIGTLGFIIIKFKNN